MVYKTVNKIIAAFSGCALLLTVSPVTAEVIELNDGQRIEGTIVDQNDTSVIIQLPAGTMQFHRSEIKSILPSVAFADEAQSTTLPSLRSMSHPPQKITANRNLSVQRTRRNDDESVMNVREDVNLDNETNYFIDYFGSEEAFRSAFEEFKTIAKKNPQDFKNHYKLGLSYFYLKNYENAITELSTVLGHDPKDLEARRFLAYAHYKLGNLHSAIAEFKQYLMGRSFDTEIRALLATCYYQTNYFEEAIDQYKLLLEHDPSNTSVMLKLAKIYRELGNEDKARTLEKQVAIIDPALHLEDELKFSH